LEDFTGCQVGVFGCASAAQEIELKSPTQLAPYRKGRLKQSAHARHARHHTGMHASVWLSHRAVLVELWWESLLEARGFYFPLTWRSP
jgi:hypothetical protein